MAKKISQNISTDSLFHFIKRREWLVDILKNKSFQARYVYEEIPQFKFKIGIPMKCFCDIPLGVIKKHISQYGKFGVGVKKEYARKNSFSPVIYVHDKSDTLLRYISSINKTEAIRNKNTLLPYIKWDERVILSDEGNRIRSRYYDEREWRYIPPDPVYLDLSKLSNNARLPKILIDAKNKKLTEDRSKYSLPFDYTDITYIFVRNEEDVDKVISEIRKLKLQTLEQDRLISKIITSRQIERDF